MFNQNIISNKFDLNLSTTLSSYECRYAECHYAECRYAECLRTPSALASARQLQVVSLIKLFPSSSSTLRQLKNLGSYSQHFIFLVTYELAKLKCLSLASLFSLV